MNIQTGGGGNALLITTLAMYQTVFWAEVGDTLRKQGREVAFLSFDDRSSEMLRKRGFVVFDNTTVFADRRSPSADQFDSDMAKYGIADVNHWLAHERITFDLSDSDALRSRFQRYLELAFRVCELMQSKGPITLVQELGGFLSVVACFFAARKQGVDNWFIEPSFFRGRMFFLKNSFAAQQIPNVASDAPVPEVAEYLNRTLAQRAIVIPRKDRHQYTTAFRKILNVANMRRLLQKLVDKHLLRKHQEFGHIGVHVSRHARMLVNSVRLRKRYTPVGQLGAFVYYPLHVPADMALTLRSPQYLDQLSVIDFLARSIPHSHKLAIKEHPAMIGAVEGSRLMAMMDRYDNLALLPPDTNNYEVLQACDAVVSINSKSGAEALLLTKPVLVLGDAFYRQSPLVHQVDALADLPGMLHGCLAQLQRPDPESVRRYFERVWSCTYPGELYDCQPQNIATFALSLVEATHAVKTEPTA